VGFHIENASYPQAGLVGITTHLANG